MNAARDHGRDFCSTRQVESFVAGASHADCFDLAYSHLPREIVARSGTFRTRTEKHRRSSPMKDLGKIEVQRYWLMEKNAHEIVSQVVV